MKFSILIIDDEPSVANSLRRILLNDETEIETANSPKEALKKCEQKRFDLIMLDYNLGTTDGLTVYKSLKEVNPDSLMIMITAYGNIELAVRAMKEGAYDFLEKNQSADVVQFTVKRALDSIRLRKEVEALRSEFSPGKPMASIIAKSPTMQKMIKLAEKYAQTDSTILITGETGTGKNVLAEYIHFKSNRVGKPFLAINCCAIPSNLIESELFGYEKGAFTGASASGKSGLLEKAHQGTLFLDEIGEFNLELQGKLLHVLENREFYRIGSVSPISSNVRIIAATNADLAQMVEEKSFRADLYYRLSVATIHLPPLRERKEDIIPLAKLFINEFNRKFKKNIREISPEAQAFLLNSPWIGNIRELKHLIERILILTDHDVLTLEEILQAYQPVRSNDHPRHTGWFTITVEPVSGENLLHQANRKLIQIVMEQTDFNVSRAARILGVPRTTLNFYLQKFGIKLSGKQL